MQTVIELNKYNIINISLFLEIQELINMSQSLGDLIQQCLESQQGYTKYADSIAAYAGDTTKNM